MQVQCQCECPCKSSCRPCECPDADLKPHCVRDHFDGRYEELFKDIYPDSPLSPTDDSRPLEKTCQSTTHAAMRLEDWPAWSPSDDDMPVASGENIKIRSQLVEIISEGKDRKDRSRGSRFEDTMV